MSRVVCRQLFDRLPEEATLVPIGDLDHSACFLLASQLRTLSARQDTVRVDLSQVTRIDDHAAHVLRSTSDRLRSTRRRLRLVNASPEVGRVLQQHALLFADDPT